MYLLISVISTTKHMNSLKRCEGETERRIFELTRCELVDYSGYCMNQIGQLLENSPGVQCNKDKFHCFYYVLHSNSVVSAGIVKDRFFRKINKTNQLEEQARNLGSSIIF